MTDLVRPLLAPLVGAQVAGGCNDCAAFQTVEESRPNIWTICVHHDDGCPTLAALRARPWRDPA